MVFMIHALFLGSCFVACNCTEATPHIFCVHKLCDNSPFTDWHRTTPTNRLLLQASRRATLAVGQQLAGMLLVCKAFQSVTISKPLLPLQSHGVYIFTSSHTHRTIYRTFTTPLILLCTLILAIWSYSGEIQV